jgi:glycine cleavage system H protein
VKVNKVLEEKPELVNEDCWGEGWMVVIKPSSGASELLDAPGYKQLVAESAH